MVKFRLSITAEEDLKRIHAYGTRVFGNRQADKYFMAFFSRFEEIASRPESFEDVSHIAQGYRRCVSGVDSIYFRIVEGTVEIMTIIGRQEFYP